MAAALLTALLLLALPQGIHEAAERGDVERVRGLVGLGQDPDIASARRGGRTPLHLAAENGHAEVVAVLLAADARAAARTVEGWTPLHLAAANAHAEAARALLRGGAPTEAADGLGDLALHLAAENGWSEVVAALLEHGAEVDGRDRWSRTPLMRAAAFGQFRCVALLLEKGAEVGARSASGGTALHAAAASGEGQAYGLLLVAGADPAVADGFGRTPAELLERSSGLARAPLALDDATREQLDPRSPERPRFVVWVSDGGYLLPGVERPSGLELAIWPDGAVLFAADADAPDRALRVGRLAPGALAALGRELDESGWPAIGRAGVSGPHSAELDLFDLRTEQQRELGVDVTNLRRLDARTCSTRDRRVLRAWLLARHALRRALPAESCALEQLAPDGRFRGWSAGVRLRDWIPR